MKNTVLAVMAVIMFMVAGCNRDNKNEMSTYLEKNVTALENTNKDLELKIAGLQGERRMLTNQVSTLQDLKTNLTAEVAAIKDQNKTLSEKSERLQAESTTLKTKVSDLTGQAETLKKDKTTLERTVRDLEAENTTLKGQVNTLSALTNAAPTQATTAVNTSTAPTAIGMNTGGTQIHIIGGTGGGIEFKKDGTGMEGGVQAVFVNNTEQIVPLTIAVLDVSGLSTNLAVSVDVPAKQKKDQPFYFIYDLRPGRYFCSWPAGDDPIAGSKTGSDILIVHKDIVRWFEGGKISSHGGAIFVPSRR